MFLLFAASAAANPVAFAVLGYDVVPYQEAVRGFESICPLSVQPFVMSENKGVDVLEKIRQKHPEIIITIGLSALSAVSGIEDIPILYLMVPKNSPGLPPPKIATGIGINVDPAVVFDIIKKALPDVENIGVLYNPTNTGELVRNAHSVLEGSHIRLISETIGQPGEIKEKLDAIKPHIDAFWMLPDMTLMTPETVEILLLFSLENKIPIITFSEKYVRMGALLSIGSDPYDMGRQAGEMANRICNNGGMSAVTPEYARNPVVILNKKVIHKLRVWVAEDQLKDYKIIE